MSARIHTKNSPVLNIKGLSYWYEPVLEDSFLTEDGLSGDSIEDGDAIKTWLDQNNLRVKRHNSVQMTANRQPKYYKDIFNGIIPALRFDGNDGLVSSNVSITGEDLTIFVVVMRASVVQHSTTLSLYDATGFYNSSSAALRAFWQTSPDYDTRPFRTASSFPSMTSLSNNIPYIASLYFDGSDGFYNINGGSYTSTSSTGQFNPDPSIKS